MQISDEEGAVAWLSFVFFFFCLLEELIWLTYSCKCRFADVSVHIFFSQFETETPFFNGQREKSFVSSWRRWMPRGWWRNHFTICLSLEFSWCEWRKGSISLTRSTTVQGRKDLNKTNSPHSCTVPLWVFDLMLYWCLNMLQVAPLINLYQTSSGTLTLNILIYRSVWRW